VNTEIELGTYSVAVEQLNDEHRGINLWFKNYHFPILAPFALDTLALPASEDSTECVFSHFGDLTRAKVEGRSHLSDLCS